MAVSFLSGRRVAGGVVGRAVEGLAGQRQEDFVQRRGSQGDVVDGDPAASSDRRASRSRSVPASTPMRTRRVSSSTCGPSWSTRARAAAHVAVLEARDQALHRQLAVLRAAAVVEPMTRGFARILGRRGGAAFGRWLIGQLDAHTDPRAVRYWQPVGIIQGRPEGEFAARVADHAWLMAALRHHTATRSTAPVSTTASG